MIKLEDLILVTKSHIAIMNGSHQSIVIDPWWGEVSSLSDTLLARNVKEIRVEGGIILIWLEGYGD